MTSLLPTEHKGKSTAGCTHYSIVEMVSETSIRETLSQLCWKKRLYFSFSRLKSLHDDTQPYYLWYNFRMHHAWSVSVKQTIKIKIKMNRRGLNKFFLYIHRTFPSWWCLGDTTENRLISSFLLFCPSLFSRGVWKLVNLQIHCLLLLISEICSL